MDGNLKEVLVTLTPIKAPEENERVLVLNPSTKHIEVGRASKNTTKGLVAAKDNAWFDSPIMSRQHAKFILNASRAVCLLDYGSTHGTYVGDRRLAANTEYILSNTEIITFGVRVTCGSGTFPSKSADDRTSLNAARSSKVTVADVGDAVTYPAKEFRVTFHRRAWNPDKETSSAKNPPSRKAQFCVPDEDCDSLSDGGSVQILKSQVRAFSVPSSDGSPSSDEEEANVKSSEPHHDAHKNPSEAAAPSLPSKNTNSTPNQPIEIWNDLTPQTLSHPINPKQTEFHDRLANLDSTGASHFNPIDLEGSTSRKAMVTCNDSEDEGPEVFSSKRKSIPSTKSASPVLHSSSTPTPGFFKPRSTPSVMQDAEKCVVTADDSSNEEEKNIGASEIRSQSASSEMHMTNSSSGKLTGNSMDDLDSMDEDDFESDDFSPRECSGNLNSSSQSSSFCGTGQMLSIASPYDFTPSYFGNSSHREHQSILNHFKPQVSFDTGENNVLEFRGEKQVTCLLPNWTDRLSCNDKMIDVGQENLNDTHRAAQRPPSPSDAALAKKATSVDNLKHNWSFEGGSQVPPPLLKYREFPPEAASVDFTPTEPSRDSFFDGLDPGWTQCGDDRYSFRLQRELQRDNHSNIQPPLQRLNSFVADHDPRKYMTVAPWISTAAPFNQGGYTENRGFPVTKEDSICKYLAEAELQLPHKETESHPPRLNIADIVNPHADMSLGLKRKADEISSDEGERKALEESQISLVETSQVLPDAQPRENMISIETSVLEESPDNTNKVSLHTSEPLETFETDQPPKKKVKFSRPSAIGVGKFLSGVCVGIVGAFALFIATIPMAVREEALSDLTNSS